MLAWRKKERCKACPEERAVRYCLRRNKELGWKCCNNYRSDGKCPELCPYTPKKSEDKSPLPPVKTDSRTELLDFLNRYLQFWKHREMNELAGKTPQQLSVSEEGRYKLKTWLGGFVYPDRQLLIILNDKLNLDLSVPDEKIIHPETLAGDYLDSAIAQDWERVIAMYPHSNEYPADIFYRFMGVLSSHPVLKKVKSYSVLSAGLTEDRQQSFVFCELNGKSSWVFIHVLDENRWNLFQAVNGSLQDYYAQKELFRNIAAAISINNSALAATLISEAENRFPLCADVFYYQGLSNSLDKNSKSAKSSFSQAIALEPNWSQPKLELALILMQDKDFIAALRIFEQLRKANPQDINALNNEGICYLGLEQPEQAKSIWQKALQLDPSSEIIQKNLQRLTHE